QLNARDVFPRIRRNAHAHYQKPCRSYDAQNYLYCRVAELFVVPVIVDRKMVQHCLGLRIYRKTDSEQPNKHRGGCPMARKKTLNARRLTKREVQALITSGVRPRPDLSAALEERFANGYRLRPLVFELEGDRYLYVFDEHQSGLGGKGDIYPADYFHRLVRRTAKVREDSAHWRGNSVSHWAYHSQFKHELLSHLDMLVEQLRSTMARSRNELDLSYKSLDIVSKFVEGIGIERAQKELYDHLV